LFPKPCYGCCARTSLDCMLPITRTPTKKRIEAEKLAPRRWALKERGEPAAQPAISFRGLDGIVLGKRRKRRTGRLRDNEKYWCAVRVAGSSVGAGERAGTNVRVDGATR
jgi:hypothetical protein